MKRRFWSVMLVGAMALSIAAGATVFAEDAPASPEDIDVYWIGKTLNNPWWISVSDFAQQEADALGVNLTIARNRFQ